ncbi:MAG: hypothetical protein R2844_11845 [Caldilineales bacterium]
MDRSHLNTACASSCLTTGVLVGLGFACVLLLCMSCFLADLADESDVTLVETEVVLSSGDFSELHTMEDWEEEFVELLHDVGWDFRPYLISLESGVSCQEPDQTNWLTMVFQARESKELVPFLKDAYVSYHPDTSIASILIEEQALRLKRDPEVQLAHHKIDFAEAIEIANLNGGAQFQQELNHECYIVGYLRGDSWEILYAPPGPNTGPHLSVQIDAVTGRVKRSKWNRY